MPGSNRIIHFPFMHKEFVAPEIHSLGIFLDPGLNIQDSSYFQPERLILDPRQSRTFLEQCMQFGEQFKKPSDMAVLGVQKMEDFYSGTTQSIQFELSTYGRGEEEHQDTKYLQAQKLLLLDYALEERILELQRINEDISLSWSRLNKALGTDEEEQKFWTVDREAVASRLDVISWPKLLWAFVLFASWDVFLLIHDDFVCQELEEWGAVWQEKDPRLYFPSFPSDAELYISVLGPEKLGSGGYALTRDVQLLRTAFKT